MKNTYFFIALVSLASVLTGCHKKSDKDESQGPRAVHVAEAVTDSVTLYHTYPGTLASATKTNVVARVSGNITAKHFTAGQYVRKGQPLFTIESTTYSDAVERAQASLATAQSQHEYYSKQAAAMRKALEADAVSKMQVIEAESNMQQAAASIKDAQAALSTARQNLAYCTVTAPSSGYITSATLDVGNYVNGAGAAVTLATIYDNANLDAVFSLSDTQYEELVGSTGGLKSAIYRNVPLTFREPLNRQYTTNLYYEAPTVDQATGTMTLKGHINNPGPELKNGMYVTVSLPYGTNPHAILVKDAALSSDQSGYYLYTVNDSNVVHHTPVQVGGIFRDSLRVVTSGISPGEKYVTRALLTVKSGEKIKPILEK